MKLTPLPKKFIITEKPIIKSKSPESNYILPLVVILGGGWYLFGKK